MRTVVANLEQSIPLPSQEEQLEVFSKSAGHKVAMTILGRITADAQELRRHGGHPMRLHLTTDNAIRLQYELISEGGPLAHSIMQGGLRQAISEIQGLRIVWKSQHFEIV
jgi:hypothetical protein